MPSVFAHPFVALGLAPFLRRHGVGWRIGLLGAVCTLVPDLDAIGFRLGVPYESMFGHRGFTHSFFFAALLALLLTLVLGVSKHERLPVGAFLFLATASHGLLDAITSGGHGVAFLAPFSAERYFFPWRPIAVSPLSIERFFSGRGLAILASELRWVILPSLAFACVGGWSSRRRATRPA